MLTLIAFGLLRKQVHGESSTATLDCGFPFCIGVLTVSYRSAATSGSLANRIVGEAARPRGFWQPCQVGGCWWWQGSLRYTIREAYARMHGLWALSARQKRRPDIHMSSA